MYVIIITKKHFNMKTIIYFFWVIFLCSCEQQEKKIYDLNLEDAVETKVTLSDIAETVIYIPLSNECPIKMINRVMMTDSLIFIGALSSEVLAFDQNGKLQRKIGKLGNGPGEYHYGSCFTIDSSRQRVLLLDQNRILEYNYLGEFIRQFSLSEWGDNFQEIHTMNGLLYVFEPISFGFAKYDWIVLNESGDLIAQKFNAIPGHQSEFGGNCYVLYDGNNLLYTNLLNDTVFAIQGLNYNAKYLLHAYQPEKTDVAEEFNLLDIVSTEGSLLMRYYKNSQFWLTLYSEDDNKIKVLRKTQQINSRDENPGIYNDWDGGCSFVPKFRVERDGESWICGYRFAYEIKEKSLHNTRNNDVSADENERRRFEDLAIELNENDNPVLMLVKFKK